MAADSKEMLELRRRLQEMEQEAQASKQEAQASKQEAQALKQEMEQRAQASAQRAQVSDQRIQELQTTVDDMTQLATLDEYLMACHDRLFSRLRIEPNPELRSKGTIPQPRDKWCPTTLKPWAAMIDAQRRVLGNVYTHWPDGRRVFHNRFMMAALSDNLAGRAIADERVLESFLHHSVEDPVRNIINELNTVDAAGALLPRGNGIVFENHPHALSDGSAEVVEAEQQQQQQQQPALPPTTPNRAVDRTKLRPDQICVFGSDDAGRTMVYVCEYKPPHKLTAAHISLGLRQPLNVYADVVNRETVPTDADTEAKFLYDAERLTASAVTQTYNYMIEGGLEYGLLTTGEMIVFLHIDWADPSVLLFHLANPAAEVAAHAANAPVCTAVGQYLAFSLMALESSMHGQDERARAKAGLKTWTEDFEATYRSTRTDSTDGGSTSAGSPDYEPVSYRGVNRSPYVLRWGRRPPVVPDGPARELRRRDPRQPPDSDSDDAAPDTPSPVTQRRPGAAAQRSRPTRTQTPQRGRGGGGGGGGQARDSPEYCTQKCLLGLVRGGVLDLQCPNVALHDGSNEKRHAIDHGRFQALLRKQLEHTLDDGITPLPDGGARGVLFRVTLLAHGYTFVAKGTVGVFVPHLEHEAAVYQHLQALQGVHVPVLLGAIDLRSMDKVYYFAHRVYIVHLTFLSWGGRAIQLGDMGDGSVVNLKLKAMQSLGALHRAGVVHGDVRLPNMLLNAEVGGVVLIDFERAAVLDQVRRPLASLVLAERNGRSRTAKAVNGKPPNGKTQGQRRITALLANDVAQVGLVFNEPRCL